VSAGRSKRTAEKRSRSARWIVSETMLAARICAVVLRAVLKLNESAASPQPRRIQRKLPACRPLEIDRWKMLGSTKGMAASR
jgi:hypothetical protein